MQPHVRCHRARGDYTGFPPPTPTRQKKTKKQIKENARERRNHAERKAWKSKLRQHIRRTVYYYLILFLFLYPSAFNTMGMSPWWTLCTLHLSHARWSYRRQLGLLCACSMCDVNNYSSASRLLPIVCVDFSHMFLWHPRGYSFKMSTGQRSLNFTATKDLSRIGAARELNIPHETNNANSSWSPLPSLLSSLQSNNGILEMETIKGMSTHTRV